MEHEDEDIGPLYEDWSMSILSDGNKEHVPEMVGKITKMLLAAGEDTGFGKEYECIVIMRHRDTGESLLKIESTDLLYALLLLNRFAIDEWGEDAWNEIREEAMKIDQEEIRRSCCPSNAIAKLMKGLDIEKGEEENGQD